MDNRNDDMIPEWQVKKESVPPEPPLQPAEPYFGMSPLTEAAAPAPVNSGLGVASFIMSIVGIICSAASIAFIVSVVFKNGEVQYNAEDSETIASLGIGGLGFMVAGFIMFIGFILGIVGLVQKNRKKGFAIAGTILNGLPIALFVILFVIGFISGFTNA